MTIINMEEGTHGRKRGMKGGGRGMSKLGGKNNIYIYSYIVYIYENARGEA